MANQNLPTGNIYPTCPPMEPERQTKVFFQDQVTGYGGQPGYSMQQTYIPSHYPGYPQQAPPNQYGSNQNGANPGQGPPQQSVVYQREHSRVWPRYRHKSSWVIGWIQIVIACMCIAFNAIGLAVQRKREYAELNEIFIIGAGFWGSFFFLVSGGFAIGAAKQKTTSFIVANMVFSILSSILCLVVISTGASAIGVEKSNVYHWDHEAQFGRTETERQDTREHRVSISMGFLLVGLGLLQFACCIWSSIICCSAVCCGRESAIPMTMAQTQVIFVNKPQGEGMYGEHAQYSGQGSQVGHYSGQTGQGGYYSGQGGQKSGNSMVMITNPGVFNQQQGYYPYPDATAPPSYDSTVGPTIEKQ